MDYFVSSGAIGKNTGDDFIDQKITLPVILAWQDGDANDREFWRRTLGDGNFADGDLATAQGILARHDSVNRAITIARDFAAEAADALAPFMDDADTAPLAIALANAARFAAARSS